MAEYLTVRFMESERYNPMTDAGMVRFMAITNIGTFHAEIETEGLASMRAKRKAFKDYVMDALSAGEKPCEVELG